MAAKTRRPLERERDLRDVAALYLHGLTQHEIAQRLSVSRQQIAYDLKLLRRRWQESALADFHAKKAAELAKVDELERTYWEAWERSCQIREVTTTQMTQASEAPSEDTRRKAGVRKEPRDGNPEFLRGGGTLYRAALQDYRGFCSPEDCPDDPGRRGGMACQCQRHPRRALRRLCPAGPCSWPSEPRRDG